MRRIILILTIMAALSAVAQTDGVMRRAQRAFAAGEWANAQALYGLITDRTPAATGAQSRLLASAVMRDDTAVISPVVERALAAQVPLGALLDSLRRDLRSVEGYARYPFVLERLSAERPYLKRPLMTHLLEYYSERNDGANMVRCARSLLAGLPGEPRYLDALANGLLLTGDRAGAEEAWRQAIASDPAHSAALISLAALLGDGPEALSLLMRADSIAPSPAIKARINSFPTH